MAAPMTVELRQIRSLLAGGAPVTPEDRLEPGVAVRVRTGPFRGLEGTLLRRGKADVLVIAVNFLQRGASIEVRDFEVEPIL